MWSTLVAVLGTLAGVALASATQVWADRRVRAEQERQRIVDAVDNLLAAVITYRELFWLLVADLRDGVPEGREARAARYRARSEITRARDRLVLLVNDHALHTAAQEATRSAIELSDIILGPVVDGRFAELVEEALAVGRERTRISHTRLRAVATTHIHPAQGLPTLWARLLPAARVHRR
jgi:hypothetical protein